MWVNQHKLNNSLVVFIHGIFGKRWATWKGVPDFLQSQFPTDPLLRSYDMYLYGYDTGFFRQPTLTPYVVAGLRQFLGQVGKKYQTTILIGHSQGGIVAKLFAVTMLMEGKGDVLTVDRIITIATPHRGFLLLNPLYWAHQIPVLRRFVPLKQLGQLASFSSNIRCLKRSWGDPYICGSSIQPERTRRYVYSVAVATAYDIVVGERSAAGFSVDVREYLPLGHAISSTTDLMHFICDQLRAHLPPDDILNGIKSIFDYPERMEDYIKRYSPIVAHKVKVAYPSLAMINEGVDNKAASLLCDFLFDFQKRPLRGLTFEAALLTYIDRVLGEER